MSRQPVLPLGHDAWNWVRQGGRPTRASYSKRLMQRWQNLWFEHNLRLQRLLPPAPPLQSDPLFILGLWRSGTTFLHDLLSACPGILYPANWQCMNPASFRLQSPSVRGNAVRRPMDGLMIDNLSPQEDEFALLALGVPTVYRGFIDPRRLTELTHWLEPDAWTNDKPAEWMDIWRQFLTGVVNGSPGLLVLKSPNHTFRINAIAEAFPRASYVWLVRDPVETFLSNCKMWLAMTERYAFWEIRSLDLDEFLYAAFMRAAESLALATHLLPRDRLVVATFDQLTRTPLKTINQLTNRLHLGIWSEIGPAIERALAHKAGYRKDNYPKQILSDKITRATSLLRVAQDRARSTHGL